MKIEYPNNISQEIINKICAEFDEMSSAEFKMLIEHSSIENFVADILTDYGIPTPTSLEIPYNICLKGAYFHALDVTIIWFIKERQNDEGYYIATYEEIVGWYHGEPSPEHDIEFAGKLFADYEW